MRKKAIKQFIFLFRIDLTLNIILWTKVRPGFLFPHGLKPVAIEMVYILLLFINCYPLFVICYLLFVICYLLFVICYLLFVILSINQKFL
jgi:hypothetical protein